MFDREREQRKRFDSNRPGGIRRGFGGRQGFRRAGFQNERCNFRDHRQGYRENDRSLPNRPYERNGRTRTLDSRPRPPSEDSRHRSDRPSVRSGFSNQSSIQRKRLHSPGACERTNYVTKAPRTSTNSVPRSGRQLDSDSSAHRSRMDSRYPSYSGSSSTNRDYQLSRQNRPPTNQAAVSRDRHSPRPGRPVNSNGSNRHDYGKNGRFGRQSGNDLSISQRNYRPSRSSDRYPVSSTSKSVYPPNRAQFRNSESNRWK